MKRKIQLSFLGLLLFASFGYAQEKSVDKNAANKKTTYLGIKGGYSYSTISNVDNSTGKNGMYIGVLGEHFLLDNLAIQTEVFYTTMGTDYEEDTYFGHSNGSLIMNYIAVPIMAKYYISKGFNVKAGPQVLFAVDTDSSTTTHISHLHENVNKFDIGFTTGLGYDFSSNFFVDLRFYFGAVDVMKNTASNKNFTVSTGIGYKF